MSDAAIRLGSEFIVNTSVFEYQSEPRVAALANGGYVVLWTGFVNANIPGTWDRDVESVFAQIYDANGNAVGGEFRVHADRTYTQAPSSVIALSDGGFVVVFQSNSPTIGTYEGGEIAMRRFDANGNPLGTEFRINTVTANGQDEPVIAALEGGGYVVIWQSRVGDDAYAPYDLRGQVFDANGAMVGGEFSVNTYTTSYQEYADVIGLADGSFVVVWESQDQDGSADGVYGRRFAADGSALGDEFRVNTATGENQRWPAITALADGGFLVVYDSQGHESSGWGYGIFGQRYDASGNAVGGEFQINTQTSGDQRQPDVVAMPDGGFVVAWSDAGLLRMQRFASDGTAVGPETQVDTVPEYYQSEATLEVLADGSIVVVWTSYNTSGYPDTIRGQRFAPQTFATSGDDRLAGTADNDWLGGLDGNDSIRGLVGDDTIYGGGGHDTLLGLAGSDNIAGGDGDDLIDGGGMKDTLDGGAGNDTILGDDGADWITGGEGDDSIDGGAGRSRMWGDAGNDTIRGGTSIDVVRGGVGDDSILGDAGNDRLFGDDGRDTLNGGAGDDSLVGGRDDDVLVGLVGNDTLDGGGGRDRLEGGDGNDVLVGGMGGDSLTGGAGVDQFVFEGGAFGNDRVMDFEDGVDRIVIQGGYDQADISFAQLTGATRMTLIPTGETVIFYNITVAELQGFEDFLFT